MKFYRQENLTLKRSIIQNKLLSLSEIKSKQERSIVNMKTSKNSARASLVKRPFVSDCLNQSPQIKFKFTFQETNKKSDKSKEILKEKFKEQRMIFVENQEKWDRKIDKSVEPTDSDSDINVIYLFYYINHNSSFNN